jgi:2-iminobutanoate/2-iminopropanoate deaminase
MKRRIISTEHAPAAVGPYSQAVRVGKLIYTAGQIALDPASGKLVDGDITQQTEQVLLNLQAVLKAAGSSLKRVVKTTVFLQDIGDFAAMNAVYSQFFSQVPPARSAVQVAALPLGAQVEIEAVAVVKRGK